MALVACCRRSRTHSMSLTYMKTMIEVVQKRKLKNLGTRDKVNYFDRPDYKNSYEKCIEAAELDEIEV